MEKIISKQTLRDILSYSKLRFERVKNVDYAIVRFNEPDISGLNRDRMVYGLLRIAISDTNQNFFNGYKDGHLGIGYNGESISFSELKKAANQEAWLKGLTGNIKKSELAFSIYDGADIKQSLGVFYARNEKEGYPLCPAADMSVNREHNMFKKGSVRAILSPFIKKGKLDELVEKVMSKNQ